MISPGPISREEKQRCTFAGAFDCFYWGSCSQEQLLGHIRGVWESVRLKRQLKNLLVREKDKPFQFETDSSQYTQDRVISLENHVTVLEAFKREAQNAVLILEEENLKLKNELLEKNKELKDAKTNQVASKWKIASLKDRNRKQAINKLGNNPEENKQVIHELHDQEMGIVMNLLI